MEEENILMHQSLDLMYKGNMITLVSMIFMIIPIINLLAVIAALVGTVMSIVGLVKFRNIHTDYMNAVFAMILSFVFGLFSNGNTVFSNVMGLLQSLASLAMVYFVIRATNYLLEGRWAEDVISFGDKVWKVQLAAFVAVAVCVVLAMIWVMLALIGLIVTLVVSIAAQIMFLQYLGRASRVF